MLIKNKVKRALIEGDDPIFGVYIETPSPSIVEIIGLAGFDFIRIDCHHGPANLESVENMIRAAELTDTTAFVRVANDKQQILSVLDMGAQGIIVPDVETAKEAKAAVIATKYTPVGQRGLFPSNRASRYGSESSMSYIEWARQNIMLGIQIESVNALDHLEEILNVEGIDLILTGQNDISQSLGVAGQKQHPDVLEVEEKIVSAALKVGMAVSLNISPFSQNLPQKVNELLSRGIRCICMGPETVIFRKTLNDIILKLKRSSVH